MTAFRLIDRLDQLKGDTSVTSPARGDLLYRGAAKWQNRAVGTAGQLLTVVDVGAGVLEPQWSDAPAVPVTSVNGKVGNVALSTTDIPEGGNLYYTALRAAAAAPVQSVFGRVGNIVLTGTEIVGTVNRVTVSVAGGVATLTAPQDLHAGASPTFVGLTLSGDITAGNIAIKSSGVIILYGSNTARVTVASAGIYPSSPGVGSCGISSNRWGTVYTGAVNATGTVTAEALASSGGQTINATGGGWQFTAAAVGNVTAVFKALAGQTGNVANFIGTDGTSVVASFTVAGTLQFYNLNALSADSSGNLTVGNSSGNLNLSPGALLRLGASGFITVRNSGDLLQVGAHYTTSTPFIVNAASGTQTGDLTQWASNGSATVYCTVSENGYFTTRKNTAPADAELVAGEAAYWFDSTNGAAKFMVKAKQADGTVVTGSIPLA